MKAKEIYKMIKELMAEEGIYDIGAIFFKQFGDGDKVCTILSVTACGKYYAIKWNKLDISEKDVRHFVDIASSQIRDALFKVNEDNLFD